jgi:hypothetical protein
MKKRRESKSSLNENGSTRQSSIFKSNDEDDKVQE